MPQQLVDVEFIINRKEGNEKTGIQHLGELLRFLREEGFTRDEERDLKTSLVFANYDKELVLAIYRKKGDYLLMGKLNPLSDVLPNLSSDYVNDVKERLGERGYEFEVKNQIERPAPV